MNSVPISAANSMHYIEDALLSELVVYYELYLQERISLNTKRAFQELGGGL
jgi:hypothetical protein